jgi:hypothetical protein
MGYYQEVVTEFLRVDRATFINSECLIQLNPGKTPDKGSHWFCDVVAVNLRQRRVYLCEITYSTALNALLRRLKAWSANWPGVCDALRRDSSVPAGWDIQPWLFIPKKCHGQWEKNISQLTSVGADGMMPVPKITFLESVAPWNYEWNAETAELAGDA